MTERELAGRLALGTAQFGLAYGINNTTGQPPLASVAAILQAATDAGLTLLDTAAAYGDAEARLGALAAQTATCSVVTKLSAAEPATVTQQLLEAGTRLRRSHLYGVLFHDFETFRQHPAAWDALRAARAKGQVERIGVSVYHPWQAEWLLAQRLDFNLIQLPFNVLDQRFGPLLTTLAARGVEVHVRSAFLQGLLLRDPAALPAFFTPLAPKLRQLRALAAEVQVPVAALVLLFTVLTPGVARVVVGVDSVDNLRQNLAAASFAAKVRQTMPALATLAESTDTFILPYTWPKTP